MIYARQRELRRLKPLGALLVTGGSLVAISQIVNAQIIPDNTLGAERSHLTSQGARDRIDGGAIRGSSLFHSFSELNVNAGQQVYFANPAAITNILTRVTGSHPSKILGTLGVEGRANLFLINPNGIVFGRNARLDVAGSFTATTADSIRLDRYEFKATNPQAPPLLTINITPGLQYGRNAPERVIENQGKLAVGTGQQLSLLGGTVRHSGSLIAPGGLVEISGDRVELSGMVDTQAANGTVGTFLLDPKDILIRAGTPISGATISAALSTNNVALQADNDITVDDNIASASKNNLTFLTGRSLNLMPNRTITLNGGNLTARINDPVNPVARDPGIATFLMPPGTRITTNGGNATVTSGTFEATSQINNANASIVTSSAANGGNITLSSLGDITTGLLDSRAAGSRGGDITVSSSGGKITTTQALLTDATTQAGNIFLTAAGDINVTRSITANALGQAGNLTLTAGGDLNLTSNGFIRGGTPTFGTTGNIASVGARSGTITLTSGGTLSGQDVRVANIVTGSSPGKETVIQARSIRLNRSSILALTNSSGRSGDMQVNVGEDVVLQDSNIATNANNGTTGNAGDLTLNTRRLSIIRTPGIVLPFRGVGVSATTDADSSGNSGNLTVNASESVELRGDQPGAYVINLAKLVTDLGSSRPTVIATAALGSGNAGNLTIHTGRLVTRDGSVISTVPTVGRGGDLTYIPQVSEEINGIFYS
jgi:filamentous hemagglutinin family protein